MARKIQSRRDASEYATFCIRAPSQGGQNKAPGIQGIDEVLILAMTANTSKAEERDEVTGARKEFNRSLRRLGNYLENGDWALTDRKVSLFGDDAVINNTNSTFGDVEFKRLSNGNMLATATFRHAIDKIPVTQVFLVALNPSNKSSFLGKSLDQPESTVVGTIDRKNDLIYWNDTAESINGSTIGQSYVRSMNFINLC